MYAVPLCVFILHMWGNMMCEVVCRCRGVYGAEVSRGGGCRFIRCTVEQVGNMLCEVVCKCDEGVEVCEGSGGCDEGC